MKKIIIPAILILGMASCNKPAPMVDMVGEQNKALVQKYIDATVKGDTSSLDFFLAEKFMNYGPARKDSSNRQQELDNYKKNWRESWASAQFNQAAIHAFTLPPGEKYPGDWVAVWGIVTVNSKTGAPSVTFNWHGVFGVKEGKIDSEQGFYDNNDILTQLGYMTMPPAPKEEAKRK